MENYKVKNKLKSSSLTITIAKRNQKLIRTIKISFKLLFLYKIQSMAINAILNRAMYPPHRQASFNLKSKLRRSCIEIKEL